MRAAVLGKPIAHSLSPLLHNAAYRALGLDGWSYTAIGCGEHELPGFLAGLDPGEWAGLSLTMPLKRAVLPLLHRVEPLAARAGAVNTVLVEADGTLAGHNTDVPGMVTALRAAGAGRPDGVTILGAGATACSALLAAAWFGLASARVLCRDPARADGPRAVASRLGMAAEVLPLTADPRAGDLLISTLPAVALSQESQRLRFLAAGPAAVFDVAYGDGAAPLAREARRRGLPVADGLDLLLHQAALQVELMTGRSPAPVAEMRAALPG